MLAHAVHLCDGRSGAEQLVAHLPDVGEGQVGSGKIQEGGAAAAQEHDYQVVRGETVDEAEDSGGRVGPGEVR